MKFANNAANMYQLQLSFSDLDLEKWLNNTLLKYFHLHLTIPEL